MKGAKKTDFLGPGEVGSNIKVKGMLFISIWGRNRRFWPHLGYCYESQYFHPIKVSLSVGRLEISILKKSLKNDKKKKKRRNEMES